MSLYPHAQVILALKQSYLWMKSSFGTKNSSDAF